jgi:hypothetical protein
MATDFKASLRICVGIVKGKGWTALKRPGFLYSAASRPTLEPVYSAIQRVSDILCLEVKR